MDTNTSFQTSFIPKKPLATQSAPVAPRSSRPVGILTFFSLILFIGSIIATAGLYFYKNILVGQISGLQQSLATAKQSFEPDTIQNLQTFNTRLSVSKQLLSTHTVFSPLFTLLGTLTVPSIQFTQFSGAASPDGKTFTVRMSGLSRDYKSIALQAQVFNSNKGNYFKDVVFSSLALSTDKTKPGYVTFDVSFNVDPTLLSYEKQVLQYSSTPQVPVIPQQ